VTDTNFADSAKNGLQSKVLGAPLYVWGGGFVAVFWVYKKWSDKKKASIDATLPDPNLNHPGGLPSTQTGSASLPNIVPTGGATSGINTSNAATGPLDASAWVSMGTAFLATLGYDGTKANQYLSSYATGITPTAEGARYVNLALQKYGPPQTVATGQTSLPVSGAKIIGFVRPAGKAGVFAQYDDGSLVWLKDANQQWATINSAAKQGVDPTIQELPVSDPIWQNSDVVRNNSLQYLWGEYWAHYVNPSAYIHQGADIVTDPTSVQKANQLWAQSQQTLPSTWNESLPADQRSAYASTAYQTAFPNG